MRIKVKERQTVWDLALQYCGSAEGAWDIAELNGLSLSDELGDGMDLEVPEQALVASVVGRYVVKGVEPATELSAEDAEVCPYGGIGFMCVGVDFVVS